MTHVLILPVLVPALFGAVLVLPIWQEARRVLGLAGGVLILLLALWQMQLASGNEVLVYRLGNWAAPFGIVLMVDRLATLMLVLTAVLALLAQIYAAASGWDRRGAHFHALWMFQLMGLNGAFLTGDAFNLFVFFEVLLIASYGLMLHGGGGLRLRAGVQYVVMNLAGSALFLAALGVLYAVTGTLNMADMAARAAEMPPEGMSMLRVGVVLLLLVFAVKAALVPLHFWLPITYANAPGPVAALFGVMTKLGVYAIIRFVTLVFPATSTGGDIARDLILPAALATMVLGQIGVLGTRSLTRMASFAVLASVGLLLIPVARMDAPALEAALYYMIHSTLAAGALFLIADQVIARRGDAWLRPGPTMRDNGPLAALFFVTAIALVGLPPLSGFLGKLLILAATLQDAWMVTIWAAILLTSVLALVAFTHAGSILFWKTSRPETAATAPSHAAMLPIVMLLAGLVALTVAAAPVSESLSQTVAQLLQPELYIDAVLNRQEGSK